MPAQTIGMTAAIKMQKRAIVMVAFLQVQGGGCPTNGARVAAPSLQLYAFNDCQAVVAAKKMSMLT
jgi:hypothetical protein